MRRYEVGTLHLKNKHLSMHFRWSRHRCQSTWGETVLGGLSLRTTLAPDLDFLTQKWQWPTSLAQVSSQSKLCPFLFDLVLPTLVELAASRIWVSVALLFQSWCTLEVWSPPFEIFRRPCGLCPGTCRTWRCCSRSTRASPCRPSHCCILYQFRGSLLGALAHILTTQSLQLTCSGDHLTFKGSPKPEILKLRYQTFCSCVWILSRPVRFVTSAELLIAWSWKEGRRLNFWAIIIHGKAIFKRHGLFRISCGHIFQCRIQIW